MQIIVSNDKQAFNVELDRLDTSNYFSSSLNERDSHDDFSASDVNENYYDQLKSARKRARMNWTKTRLDDDQSLVEQSTSVRREEREESPLQEVGIQEEESTLSALPELVASCFGTVVRSTRTSIRPPSLKPSVDETPKDLSGKVFTLSLF